MNFLKTLAATILGFFVAIFILIVLFIIFIIAMASLSKPSAPNVAENSVLEMNISGQLPARQSHNIFGHLFTSSHTHTISLRTLQNDLKKAKADPKIKGVVLNINNVNEGWANLQEAYRTISRFRKSSSKFVYATTNDAGINEKGYYIASAADSVFAPPESFFEFDGFYLRVSYYKGLLKKLGIKTVIARHGKYKSAVEPFFRKKMSKADRNQLGALLNEDSHIFLKAVSLKSGETIAQLNAMLNQAPHISAAYGYKQGLIDSLLYTNQLDSLIKKRMGLKAGQHFYTISGVKFARVSDESAGLQKPQPDGTIGLIYASGPIMNGGGRTTRFGREHIITAPWFKKQLEYITNNDHIKALVIRVNSPGGSGSASDVIWNMIRQVRKKMPVIVSMGPLDASGGYYFSVAADTIVAEPTTITGSIGVFALHFNARQFFNDKLGITFDEVKSNKHAGWLSPVHQFTPGEKKAFKANITSFYHTFLTKVAKGRGMSVAQVDSIAQGRVWSGKDAKKQGLVDVLGGLQKALHIAAHDAGLKHYDISVYPKHESFFHQLANVFHYKVQSQIGRFFVRNKQVETFRDRLSLLQRRGALLLFPYKIEIK